MDMSQATMTFTPKLPYLWAIMLIIALLAMGIVRTSFGASVEPMSVFYDNKNNSGYYRTANEACEAAMPNSNYTSHGAAYYPDYGPGCLYRAFWLQDVIFAQNWMLPLLACPTGFVYESGVCQSDAPDNDDSCTVGNPISIATGIKRQLEVDFDLPGNRLLPLQIARHYTSYAVNGTNHYGHGWSLSPYYLHVSAVPSENKVYVYRSPGRRWIFHLDSGMRYKSTDAPEKSLEYVSDSEGNYWRLTSGLNDQEIYSVTSGKLLELKKDNHHQMLTYSDSSTPTAIASSENLLINISDETERSLGLFYDSENLLSHVDFNNQTVLTYSYGEVKWNGNRQLTSVTFANGRKRQYKYKPYTPPTGAIQLSINNLYIVDRMNNSQDIIDAVGSTDINALSLSLAGYSVAPLLSITDENGNAYSSWGYDDQGRAVFSEHAKGVERVDLSFNADNSTTATNALGKKTIYRYKAINNTRKLTSIEGVPSTNCPGANKSLTYDANGFMASKTDFNGNVTNYSRDDQGRELSRTEATGTPQARTVTTTWDTTLNKPLVITEPERVTEYTYDAEGRLLSKQQRPHP
jgi:YD repeat-containing protein